MDYAALVHRVRELVWEHVPAGSSVAVVSKGDPALILFDRRTGWHYPQSASGQYLGHHPDTGAAAVAHLESLRVRGAEYLVVPSVYGWFLDYYTDLRNHLSREGELIHKDEYCTIYALTKRELTAGNTRTAADRQLHDLLAAVLPYGSKVVAFGGASTALAGGDEFQVLESVNANTGRDSGFEAVAERVRASGAQYLVIPSAPPVEQHADRDLMMERCSATWTTVLHHRHVCGVFAIPPADAKPARPARPRNR